MDDHVRRRAEVLLGVEAAKRGLKRSDLASYAPEGRTPVDITNARTAGIRRVRDEVRKADGSALSFPEIAEIIGLRRAAVIRHYNHGAPTDV